MTISEDLHRRLAYIGAKARLKELEAEVEEIYRVFPELRGKAPARRPSRRSRFSPEGRAAISDGMKKYWARRKADSAKKK